MNVSTGISTARTEWNAELSAVECSAMEEFCLSRNYFISFIDVYVSRLNMFHVQHFELVI